MPEGGLPAPDPAARWAPPRSVFKVVVVGAPGVGKTSLVRLLLGAPAGAASRGAPRACDLAAGAGHPGHDGGPEPTVGADFCTRAVFLDGTARPVRLHLWDTSGQERFRSVVEPCITGLEDHDAIVVVYDTSASESLEEANALIVRARRLAAGSPQVAQCRAAARQQHPRCSVLRCLGLA